MSPENRSLMMRANRLLGAGLVEHNLVKIEDLEKAQEGGQSKTSATRSRATLKALKKESGTGASKAALSKHAKAVASRRRKQT